MKSNFSEFLESIGINLGLLGSGLLGNMAILSTYKGMTWKEKIFNLISGALCANYLTPLIFHITYLSPDLIFSISFLVGTGGMFIIDHLYHYIIKLIK